MSLAQELERAAEALPELADAIRPANGDPERLLRSLDATQAARVLAWLLAEAPEEASELAAEWAEHEAGVAALAGVEEGALPRPGQKALRRVRHRLRSRGVALPEAPPAPRVVTLPGVEADLEGAFVSPLDPGGSRAVVLVDSHPSGGARIFELVVDEALGIRRCEVYKAARGKARRFLREATEGPGRTGVAVEAASARALLARIAAGQPADRSLPRPFAEWRSQLTAAPAGAPTPGEQAAAALGEPGAEDAEKVRELVARGIVGPWPPAEATLREAIEQLGEARESRILLSGPARRQRLEEILGDAAERAFDARFSELTAARFEESAYVFWRTGHEDEARACLAGARTLRRSAEAGGIRSDPVVRALLERLLAPLLQEKQEEKHEQESGSLLVKP